MANIGFDIDDTLAYTTPAFSIGFSDAAKNNYKPFSPRFWDTVNSNDAGHSTVKKSVQNILNNHVQQGDTIYAITARGTGSNPQSAKKLQKYINDQFDIPSENIVLTSSSNKTATLKALKIDTFYGDSDSDIKSAIDAGATGIRIERSPDSSYKDQYNPGLYGEQVIEGTSDHEPVVTWKSSQANILDVAKDLKRQKDEIAADKKKINAPLPAPPTYTLTKDEMNKIESEFSKSLKENNTPSLDYVTASQARIFIGGILVDEAYDVQYNYRETKEPIYGYNSKHWDAVLDGTVIIYGSFSINYVHDAYLYSILSKLDSKKSNYNNNKSMIEEDRKNAIAYQSALRGYKGMQKDITNAKQTLKKLQAEVVQAEAELNMGNMRRDLNEKDLQERLDNANNTKNAFWNGLTPSYQIELQGMISEFDDTVKDGLERIQSDGAEQLRDLSDKVNKAQEEVDSVNAQIKEMQSNIDMLKDLQKTLNALTDPDDYSRVVQEINTQQNSIMGLTEISLEPAQLALDDAKQELQDAREGLQYQIEDANSDLQSLTDQDPNVAEAKRLELTIKRIKAEMSSIKSQQEQEKERQLQKSKAATEMVKAQQGSISTMEASLSSMLTKIASAKAVARKNYAAIDALATAATDGVEARPEDFHKFNLLIEYNGKIHKRLEECELVSHSHIISQSGQPVKEYYQFIARRLV